MPAATPADLPAPLVVRKAWVVRGFQAYATWLLRGKFWAMKVLPRADGTLAPPVPGPTIFYANHPSWWDPLVLLHVAERLFGERPTYGPIAAEQLTRYRSLAHVGLFGVAGGTKGAADFLRLGHSVLTTAQSHLWLTAQGTFADARQRPAGLKPGLAHLALRVPGTALVPVALEYPFGTEARPSIALNFGAPVWPTPNDTPATLLATLEQRLTAAQDALAAAVINQQPLATLWRGRGLGRAHMVQA